MEVQPLASPQIWRIKMDGHIISMVSLRDDTVENTDYFSLHHRFPFLTGKQMGDLKWLLEQLYDVVIDEGSKRIIRQKFYEMAKDTDDLIDTANNNVKQPEWIKGLIDIRDTSKEIMDMLKSGDWEVLK